MVSTRGGTQFSHAICRQCQPHVEALAHGVTGSAWARGEASDAVARRRHHADRHAARERWQREREGSSHRVPRSGRSTRPASAPRASTAFPRPGDGGRSQRRSRAVSPDREADDTADTTHDSPARRRSLSPRGGATDAPPNATQGH